MLDDRADVDTVFLEELHNSGAFFVITDLAQHLHIVSAGEEPARGNRLVGTFAAECLEHIVIGV